MKHSTAVALVILGIAVPVWAQHGAAHGGFASHGAPAFHSAPSSGSYARPTAPSGFRGAPAYPGSRYPGAYSGLSRGYPTGAYANRYAGRNPYPGRNSYSAPDSYVRRAYNPYRDNRDGNHRPPYRRPYRGGYGIYGGGYSVWPSPYYLGDPYLYGGYDDSGYDGSMNYGDDGDQSGPPYAADEGGYAAEPPQQDQIAPDPNYPGQNYAPGYNAPDPNATPGYGPQYAPGSAPAYRPNYQPSPATPRAIPQSVAPSDDQVTVILVYKDGRPSEQIHNYILSRDSISVWDQHPREIPIDQIDLAATEQANREAGVNFHLPRLPRIRE
jgi:hypothetical protein